MPDKLRFHLDESVTLDLAEALTVKGIDITTSQDVGLRTRPDEEQWEYCKREGRIIITHDEDFLRLAAVDYEHYGIIFCKQANFSIGAVILECMYLLEQVTPNEMKGCVEYW